MKYEISEPSLAELVTGMVKMRTITHAHASTRYPQDEYLLGRFDAINELNEEIKLLLGETKIVEE